MSVTKQRLQKTARRRAAAVRVTVAGAPTAFRHRKAFDDVGRFCLFLGYPRSGHSLVGSLLSAHPDAVISHELQAHRYVRRGYPRQLLYGMILYHDARFTRLGRVSAGYEMIVPGQWQGTYRTLRVIGDKRGGNTTQLLAEQPHVLDRIRATVGVPVRFVHVIRNPYDNIATLATRQKKGDLERALSHYAARARMAKQVRAMLRSEELIDVHHEELVTDPQGTLSRLCAFLGLEPSEDYLRACADIVFDKPTATRNTYTWTHAQRLRVEQLCEEIPYLSTHGLSP